jgi:hypothetical protein
MFLADCTAVPHVPWQGVGQRAEGAQIRVSATAANSRALLYIAFISCWVYLLQTAILAACPVRPDINERALGVSPHIISCMPSKELIVCRCCDSVVLL